MRLDVSSRFMNINEPCNMNATGEIYDFSKMHPYSAPVMNPNGTYAYLSDTEGYKPTLNARLANEGYKRTRRNDNNILYGATWKMDFLTQGLAANFRLPAGRSGPARPRPCAARSGASEHESQWHSCFVILSLRHCRRNGCKDTLHTRRVLSVRSVCTASTARSAVTAAQNCVTFCWRRNSRSYAWASVSGSVWSSGASGSSHRHRCMDLPEVSTYSQPIDW